MSEKLEFKNEKVKQVNIQANLKIPKELIPTIPVYHFEVHYSDQCFARKKLYFIKQKFLCKDKKAKFISQSHRDIPLGVVQIKQLPLIISNFSNLFLDQEKYKEGDVVHITLNNVCPESEKMKAKAIVFEKQFIGLLYPNEVLDETFVVREYVHQGCHAYHTFTIDQDKDKREGVLHVSSYYDMKTFQKMMDDSQSLFDSENDKIPE